MKIGDYIQILPSSGCTAIRNRIGTVLDFGVKGVRKDKLVNDYIEIIIGYQKFKISEYDFKILDESIINEYRNYKPQDNEKSGYSCIKGYQVYFDTKYSVYRYIDDDTLVHENPRSCSRCGKTESKDGHDYCIANLPGVKHACCGHGVEDAYVMFENGIIIRGKIEYPY